MPNCLRGHATLNWELWTGDCKTAMKDKKNKKLDILYIVRKGYRLKSRTQ